MAPETGYCRACVGYGWLRDGPNDEAIECPACRGTGKDYASWLRAALAERGLTREQAARQIGCSLDALQKWLAGTRAPTGLYRVAVERWLKKGGNG